MAKSCTYIIVIAKQKAPMMTIIDRNSKLFAILGDYAENMNYGCRIRITPIKLRTVNAKLILFRAR